MTSHLSSVRRARARSMRRASAIARVIAFATCLRLVVLARAERCAENVTSFQRWADLRAFRNPSLAGAVCAARLHARGVAGCSNDVIDRAPLVRVNPDGTGDLSDVVAPRVLLATPAAWQNVVRRAFLSADAEAASALRANVRGVLVESVAVEWESERDWVEGFAPGRARAANATGGRTGGADATALDLRGMPMMLLDRASTLVARAKAKENADAEALGKGEESLWNVEVDMRMSGLGKQPTISPPTSLTCLRAGTCLPLGGYSVVATAPPLREASASGASVVLVVARIDANGFFRDASPAVNARMSGLIALMALAKTTKKMFMTLTEDDVAHPVAFVALSGEDFGRLGSERLAREMAAAASESHIPGLAGRKIRAIIELGPMGLSSSYAGSTTPSLHLHGANIDDIERKMDAYGASSGNATWKPGVRKILDSSEPSFKDLRAQSLYQHAYFSEDHDESIDPFVGTHLDVGAARSIDVDRLANAVHAIARYLRVIALKNVTASTRLDVEAGNDAVRELTTCLADKDSGLSECELGKKFLGDLGNAALGATPSDGFIDPVAMPTRYPNVLVGLASDAQSHMDKNRLARFVWSYLAEATSRSVAPQMCESNGSCAAEDTVCVGHGGSNAGECHDASPRYVLALSTRLSYDASTGAWNVGEPRDDVERDAPLWTESNWSPSIGFTLSTPPGPVTFSAPRVIFGLAVGGLLITAFVRVCCSRRSGKKKARDDERESLIGNAARSG